MRLVEGKVQIEPGERAIVVEDHGFMAGIFAVIVYRQHRFKVYQRPTAASVGRIRRVFKESGDFARLRGSGSVGPHGTTPYPREYWIHPGPWETREPAEEKKGDEN